jgi:hypothetical protein
MQTKRAVLGFGFAAAMMSLSSAASATEYLATYTGTVSSGTDYLGLFGDAGADLTNLKFTAKFIYDPSLGYLFDLSPEEYFKYGGTVYPTDSPVSFASLTINGITKSSTTTPTYSGVLTQNPAVELTDPVFETDYDWENSSNTEQFSLGEWIASTDLPFSLTTPFDVTSTSGIGGEFSIVDGDASTGGYFISTELVVTEIATPPSGTPEPAEWAMMLVGFLGMGTAIRMARSAAAPSRA